MFPAPLCEHRYVRWNIVDLKIRCVGVGTHVRVSLTSVLLPGLPIYTRTNFSHPSFSISYLHVLDNSLKLIMPKP